MSKDLKVIDNGDGTLTITVLATGNFAVYGADGKAIARNPGQVRFQFIVDHGGTPADPSDDVELEDLGVIKGSTDATMTSAGPQSSRLLNDIACSPRLRPVPQTGTRRHPDRPATRPATFRGSTPRRTTSGSSPRVAGCCHTSASRSVRSRPTVRLAGHAAVRALALGADLFKGVGYGPSEGHGIAFVVPRQPPPEPVDILVELGNGSSPSRVGR